MMIFKNAYKELKQENIDNSVKLRRENRLMIEEMMDYITANSIALFEIEILKKDLIGIAMEAETEKVSLKSKLGVSKKEFCDSLLKDAMKKNPFEIVLLWITHMMIAIAGFNTMIFLLLGCPNKFGVVLSALVYSCVFIGISEFIELKAKGKYGYDKAGKNRMIKIEGIFLLLWIIYTTIVSPRFDLLDTYILTGNGWKVTGTLLVLTVLIYLFNNFYWNKQSEKYNWK